MKMLLILRHAKSSWKDLTLTDHDRPLNKRGKRDAPRMGRWLRQHDAVPQLIISSTAKRARTTAKLVADGMDYHNKIVQTRDFFHASPEEYEAYLQTLDNDIESLMIVGHNPGIELLVEQLSGTYERMPTCSVAWFNVPINNWSAFDTTSQAILNAIWRPKEID